MEGLVHGHLAPRQGSKAEGHHKENSLQNGSGKPRGIKGKGREMDLSRLCSSDLLPVIEIRITLEIHLCVNGMFAKQNIYL